MTLPKYRDSARSDRCRACGYDEGETVLARWAFYIPLQPPSQNEFKGMDPHVYRKIRHTWGQWMELAKTHVAAASKESKRRVWFHRMMGAGQRSYDKGNFVGGCKPILDSMMAAGLVYNDSPWHLEEHHPPQHRAKEWDERSLSGLADTAVRCLVPYDRDAGGLVVVVEELG